MEAAFLNDLNTRVIDDKHDQLTSEFRYFSKLLGYEIVVPAGFITDYASVPKLPLVFLCFGDTAKLPAVIHDWIYQTHMVSREMADKIFLEAMGTLDYIPEWKHQPMYLAVRGFGWRAWGKWKDRAECFGNNCIIKFQA